MFSTCEISAVCGNQVQNNIDKFPDTLQAQAIWWYRSESDVNDQLQKYMDSQVFLVIDVQLCMLKQWIPGHFSGGGTKLVTHATLYLTSISR